MKQFGLLPQNGWHRLLLVLPMLSVFAMGCTGELKEKLQEKETELAQTRTNLEAVQSKLSGLETAHSQQTEKLQQVEQQRKKLTEQVKGLEENQTTLQQERTQMQEQLAKRQQSIQQLQTERDILIASQAKDKKRMVHLTGRVADLTKQASRLDNTLQQTTKELEQVSAQAQQRRTDLTAQIQQLQQNRQDLEQRVSMLDTEHRKAQGQLAAAVAAKTTATEQAGALSTQTQQLQKQLTASGQEVEQLQAEAALIPGMQTRLAILTQERGALQGELEQITEQASAFSTQASVAVPALFAATSPQSSALALARSDIWCARLHVSQKSEVSPSQPNSAAMPDMTQLSPPPFRLHFAAFCLML